MSACFHYFSQLLFFVNVIQAYLDIRINMQHKIFNDVLELSWNFASRWRITSSALVIIDSGNITQNWSCSKMIPLVTYSVNYVYPIKSKTLCDDINTVDFHPTVMLIIFRHNGDDLYKILQNHYRWINYKIGTLLILFPIGQDIGDFKEESRRLFQVPWSLNIVSVMVVYWSVQQKRFYWFTFNGYINKIYDKTGDFDFTNNLKNVSSNMHNHKIRSCFWINLPESALLVYKNNTIKPASLEGKAFYLMAQLLNVNSELVPPVLNLSSFEASIYYDTNKLCDVFFSTISRPSHLESMANTYPIFMDYWCVMMPKGKVINNLQNFFMPFETLVWHYLIISLCICFTFWMLIKMLKLPWHTNADKQFLSLTLLGVLLSIGNSIKYQFLTYGSRIFIFFTAIFGFFISYSYQSLLFGFLMVPRYYENLHTLREIGESGIKIAMVRSTLKFWKEFGNYDDYPEQFNKALIGVDSSKHVKMIETNNANFGYVLKQTRIKYVIRKTKDNPVFYQARECLIPIPRGYSVACNFPLSQKIEALSQRFAEMGLFEYWKSYIGLEKLSTDDNVITSISEGNFEIKSFSMKNIIYLLQIWALAVALCIAVFVGEILWCRNRVKR